MWRSINSDTDCFIHTIYGKKLCADSDWMMLCCMQPQMEEKKCQARNWSIHENWMPMWHNFQWHIICLVTEIYQQKKRTMCGLLKRRSLPLTSNFLRHRFDIHCHQETSVYKYWCRWFNCYASEIPMGDEFHKSLATEKFTIFQLFFFVFFCAMNFIKNLINSIKWTFFLSNLNYLWLGA